MIVGAEFLSVAALCALVLAHVTHVAGRPWTIVAFGLGLAANAVAGIGLHSLHHAAATAGGSRRSDRLRSAAGAAGMEPQRVLWLWRAAMAAWAITIVLAVILEVAP